MATVSFVKLSLQQQGYVPYACRQLGVQSMTSQSASKLAKCSGVHSMELMVQTSHSMYRMKINLHDPDLPVLVNPAHTATRAGQQWSCNHYV